MNKKTITALYTAGVFCLTLIILLHPAECLVFSLNGLNLWFQKMIPALFPFMVLSGVMIRMNLTDSFVRLLSPVLQPLFRLQSPCIYVIFAGFLCGFPMGAHVTAQLYGRKQISRKEAEFLLAFCNNIGPVYFISYALPAIGITASPVAFLFGMYGLPFIYGLFLRYTLFSKSIPFTKNSLYTNKMSADALPFLAALDESVTSALLSIARLGGYMIFFNLLNIIPAQYLPGQFQGFISCILEISGGLQLLQNSSPVFALCALSFGGLSCLAQTYSMIHESGLSIKNYVFHKAILTAFSLFYYAVLASKAF